MKPESILLVSNYYPPERGAAPNRIQMLATALANQGYGVEVVCPLPNYPAGRVMDGFRGKLYSKSTEGSVTVHRLWLWPSKSSNKFIRLISMLSFSKSLAIFFILRRIPATVFVQYSPVFVGTTAVFWSWIFRKKIVLNVSDLWPLAGLEMGLLDRGFYYSLLERMELFCYKKAGLILGQSEEILTHVSKRTPLKTTLLYRNIPDFEPPAISERVTHGPIKIVYAGLLGVAQGLSEIFKHTNIPPHIEFHIYGDGPDLAQLETPKNLQLIFHGTVTRELLHKELVHFDIAFIPLANRIYGSVPSKIFEYARLGLPLLYMAGGEGGDLVRTHNLGWVLPVGDNATFEAFLNQLQWDGLQKFPKKTVQLNAKKAFDFEKQFETLLVALTKI